MDLKQISGLSESEAAKILKTDGYNEIPSQKKQNNLSILLRIISEPMLLLLIGSGVLYTFMGEIKDALMLVGSIFIVIGITFYQERKTEKTLEALKNLSSPRALVIRSGKQIRIPGRDVVMGDIILIREGDRIPADATILSCENLSVDESLLTGESIPVRKQEGDERMEKQRPGGDDLPFVYSGTLVVSGRGIAKVYLTGLNTEMGKIGKSLGSIKDEDSLLHKETANIVRVVAVLGIFLCGLVFLAYVFIKGNAIQGLLAGLTLSMAILPEEFPVVLIIFLTIGAWRLAKKNVLTRHSSAIETLGAATVLCADKTGTLTMNNLELTSLYSSGSFYEVSDFASTDLPEKFHNLLEYGILASQKDPFDPIEKELNETGELYLKNTDHLHKNWELIKEYPLSKELLALSHVWQSPNKKDYVIASKGAPEAILNLCHTSVKESKEILEKVKEMSDKGLRVLAGAKAIFTDDKLPKSQHDFQFRFVGLYGFIDPVRPTAKSAVKEAYAAGIRVIMITGDYPGTAQFAARKIGIKDPENFITGDELEKMDIRQLRIRIKNTNIFARVVPEQKLLIVNALKANGEIVAMTGDGVNDAPALKSAHIGIAMGERGTDVAREASDLVLLDDDFSSIVKAVRMGRRIFDNIKRAMGYLLAVHVPIAGMSVIPLLFDYPMVLLPAHIAFLELIIDPACSIVFEAEKADENIMQRPPRNIKQGMFNKRTVTLNVLQGVGILLSTFALYVFVLKSGRGELIARSFAFTSLVLSNLLLIVINLSWRKNINKILFDGNNTLLITLAGGIIVLVAVLYLPFLAKLFHLAPLLLTDFLFIGVAMYLSVGWFEALKYFRNHPAFIKILPH
jgi:Ca2+-transporting ATPase